MYIYKQWLKKNNGEITTMVETYNNNDMGGMTRFGSADLQTKFRLEEMSSVRWNVGGIGDTGSGGSSGLCRRG